jgi:hypothetical protein
MTESKTRKGAAGMPIEFLILIVIGVIFLGIAILILAPLGNVAEDEAAKAALTSCCVNFKISGGCQQGSDIGPDFICNVPETISEERKMEIGELDDKAGLDYQTTCC